MSAGANYKMNFHLVSFGDTVNYGGALTRMLVTASQWFNQNKPTFTTISVLNQQHLQQDNNFWTKHNHFFEQCPKGYGYWLWKSWAIKSAMAKIQENDIILYLDVGCQLNPKAISRFHDYVNIAAKQGICCFQLPGFTEQSWTKADTAFRILGDHTSTHMESDQIMATVVFFRNNMENKQLVDTWCDVSQEQNYRYLTDEASVLPNHSTFREHRHDQSILSLLIKKTGCTPLVDETWFHPHWRTKGIDYPIWATRNPTSQII